jgi:Tfp pilus assembly protein PilF
MVKRVLPTEDPSVENEDAINELLRRGIAHHEAGEVVEARNIYVEILERDPQNHQALDLAGLLCMQCNELEAAGDFFESAMEIEPDSGR